MKRFNPTVFQQDSIRRLIGGSFGALTKFAVVAFFTDLSADQCEKVIGFRFIRAEKR